MRSKQLRSTQYEWVEKSLSSVELLIKLFISRIDYEAFSDAQRKELHRLAALNPDKLTVRIYGAKEWGTIKDTGIEFVTESAEDIRKIIKPE